MRTFASLLGRLAALLPHEHGRRSQPEYVPPVVVPAARHHRPRFYARPAGTVVTAAELGERLAQERPRYAREAKERAAAAKDRLNAKAPTQQLPVYRDETPEDVARNALAHNVMRDADVTWATRDEIRLGIDHVLPGSGEVTASVNVQRVEREEVAA